MKLKVFRPDNLGPNANATLWTPMMLNLLKENYERLTNPELANALGLNLTVVRMKLYELGYKRMELEYWTDEQIKMLKENYRSIGDVELAEMFDMMFPKKKKWTCKHIRKKRCYLNLHRSPEEVDAVRTRNVETGRFADCAVKRWKVTGACPVGTIRIWSSQFGKPFKVIKTATGFVHYAPWLWIQHNGPVPDGHVVGFKDRNNMNVVIENLALFTRAEHAIRNRSLSQYPEELQDTIRVLRKLNKTINKKSHGKEAKQNL